MTRLLHCTAAALVVSLAMAVSAQMEMQMEVQILRPAATGVGTERKGGCVQEAQRWRAGCPALATAPT